MTGAGWGGCAIAIGQEDALVEFSRKAAVDYRAHFGREARTWITYASPGARVE
jgi:galactokinase